MSSRKKIIFLIIISAVTLCCLMFGSIKNHENKSSDQIPDSFFIVEPSGQEPNGSNNIFFIESSEPKSSFLSLSSRQGCAIESAAVQNPDSQIFIYLAGVDGLSFTKSSNAIWKVIQSLSNVHVKLINSTEFVRGTPVENLLQRGLNSIDDWQKYHKSDILRFVLLWKYAGTYMDFDVISMKSLSTLKTNFAVIQRGKETIEAGAGIINFDKNKTGRKLADFILQDLAKNFDGTKWDASSVGVLSRGIEHLCGTAETKSLTFEKCQGFSLYPHELFYAIDFHLFKYFFEEQHFDQAMETLNGSVGAHVWNFLSHNIVIQKNQRVALVELAKVYCPQIFSVPDQHF